MEVLLVAMALQVCGGVAAFVFSKSPRAATALGASGSVSGCLIGLAATLNVFVTKRPDSLRFNWDASHGAGLFPSTSEFSSETPDPISEKVYAPFFRRWEKRFSQLRILQQGHLHIYLIYILLVVVLALSCISFRTWWPKS